MISRGSEWRRWEPHIHAPGTVLNDQFSGEGAWEQYLSSIEESSPRIRALAVTDYYLTDTYLKVREYKKAGRLPDVDLIFPNVEMRLTQQAEKGFVNIHLLVAEEDPDHMQELERVLQRLEFTAHDDTFNCTRSDLIKLGKKADPTIVADEAALKKGATRFKVNFDQLRKVFTQSKWARENILVAVAGSSKDGVSGVRGEAGATLRQEIEKFSDIIFSSTPGQRDFWLGYKSVTVEQLRERYGGCKPCLHGSDAHDEEAVGKPQLDRFSWIKGDLAFDALRQACIDPENRAYIGDKPPKTAMPSQVISSVTVSGADWIMTPEIPLNPGLVTIIGARGSGKTALADLIATGCDAIPAEVWDSDDEGAKNASFLRRARRLLAGAHVELAWGGGAETNRALDGTGARDPASFPRARYLSQQFVEELCSSNGNTDGLIAEIERVIFDAHPQDDREGAVEFAQLRRLRTERFIQSKDRASNTITELSASIATEMEKEKSIDGLKVQVEQKDAQIKSYLKDREGLVVQGGQEKAKRHTAVTEATEQCRERIQLIRDQQRAVIALQDRVKSTRETIAPGQLRKIKQEYQNSRLTDEEWEKFLLDFKGDVDTNLSAYLTQTNEKIVELTGPNVVHDDAKLALIADDADLSKVTLNTLKAEQARLEKNMGDDRVLRQQYTTLTTRITTEQATLKTLQEKLADAEGAKERRLKLASERMNAYSDVFAATISEQSALEELYKPLMARLAAEKGTLGKLERFMICQNL